MESLFAFIYNSKDHFVLTMSYVELNNEMIYDLLAHGSQTGKDSQKRERVKSIEHIFELKRIAEGNMLLHKLGSNDEANLMQQSTLIL